MTDLPNGWAISKIGDVAAVIRGVTYSKADTLSENDKNSVPLLRATNLQVDAIDFNDMVYVPKKVVKEQQFLRINDIFLAASSGSISVVGKSAQVVKTNGATFGAFCSVIRPKTIHPKFLALWVQSPEIRDHWSATAKGTNINNLKPSDILDTNVPLPPLPEQQKIVELLEDHLSRLDAALADVKQAKLKAAQFRRSLLQAAFTGNLTGDGTCVMTAWKTEKLSNLLAVSIGGIWGEEAGVAEIDVSVVRVTELKAHGRIDPSSAVTRSVTLKQLASRELQEGDLLLEKSGGGPNSPVGRVGYFFQEGTRTVCSNFMQLMRPDSTKVLPKYLFYFLDGFHSNGGTIPMQTATTNIRNIKTPQYMDIDVPVPSIDEQYKIVELIEDHLSRLDASVAIADAMEKQSSSLRRSLLQAAFTGQLTKEVASV